MLGNYLDEVRKKAPLIHNITNYVTINDVANMVLACLSGTEYQYGNVKSAQD